MRAIYEEYFLWAGIGIWVLFSLLNYPFHPESGIWMELLLCMAPLVLIPAARHLFPTPEVQTKFSPWIALLSAVAFTASFLLPEGPVAGLFASFWLWITLEYALLAIKKMKTASLTDLGILAGYIFLPVGALWAVSERLGFYPLEFSPTITLLTAIHFHYAGFLLPLITAVLLRHFSQQLQFTLLSWILLGVPILALGITLSEIGFSHWVESMAATFLAIGGFTVGSLYLMYGWKNLPHVRGIYFSISGLCLMCAMVLAGFYGLRHVLSPELYLSIPEMYAIHGTLNVLGCGPLALLGWSRS